MLQAQVYKKLNPKQYVERFLSNGMRPDSRSLKDASRKFRKLNVKTGSIGTALGSAMLKMGHTTVVAGFNAELCAPEDEEGMLEVLADVKPFGSRYTKQQMMSTNTALATHVRSALLPHMDLKALMVDEDTLAWRLTLTIYCINNDGNTRDAALLAGVAALRSLRLPTVTPLDGDDEVDDGAVASVDERVMVPLQIEGYPLSVTFAIVGGRALVDPTLDEEEAADTTLTLLMSASGELRAALKPGGVPLPAALFADCVRVASSRAPQLASMLDSACN